VYILASRYLLLCLLGLGLGYPSQVVLSGVMEAGCTAVQRAEEGVVAVVVRSPLLVVLVAPIPFLHSLAPKAVEASSSTTPIAARGGVEVANRSPIRDLLRHLQQLSRL
jgi:hypothetical protein